VRTETVEKIERAIKEIGFAPNLAAKSLSRNRELRMRFLLPGTPEGVTGYMMLVEEAIPLAAEAHLVFRV